LLDGQGTGLLSAGGIEVKTERPRKISRKLSGLKMKSWQAKFISGHI
jgi:hypothetical protein